MATPRICSIPDCGKPVKKRGWCHKHYYALRGWPACSVPGCETPSKALGYCNAHWKRLKRHGDPLGGRTPWGEPERFLREVVLAYAGDDCLIWPFANNGIGYGLLREGDRMTYVHRLVCESVHGTPPTPEHEAAHSCGNGHEGCCTGKHLSWKTHLENAADMIAHGTSTYGERNPQAKITESTVRQIRALKGQLTQDEISIRVGVSQATVSLILTRKTWTFLD